MSNCCPQDRQNSGDNVFGSIHVEANEAALFARFVASHDLSPHTVRAMTNDLRKFSSWFAAANQEPYDSRRVTAMDVSGFKRHLREQRGQSVATVNRALVSVRRYLGWLESQGHLPANPAKEVKELRSQALSPKGMDGSQVRRLLREVELRGDVRASAMFHVLLYTGCRVSDLVNLELRDVLLAERSGTVVYRHGKGGKQRSVPLPLPARKALVAYLEVRPPIDSDRVFLGERGPLTDRGVRAICDKYAAITGIDIHPHLLRHTMAHRFLQETTNDLVSLAQILGHENLNTTARYTQRTQQQLMEAAERVAY